LTTGQEPNKLRAVKEVEENNGPRPLSYTGSGAVEGVGGNNGRQVVKTNYQWL
jgi:hypothetical protein